MPPGPERPPFGKASQQPLNSEQVLVSRKAMQNYNRFLTWQNISATFFQKKRFFPHVAWFGTAEGRFRDTRSGGRHARGRGPHGGRGDVESEELLGIARNY